MTYDEFCRNFRIQLNPQQTDAVRSVKGPVLLLAVPGSGKTTVLVTRLGYLIYCAGVVPEKILTLTYTVAATRDMAARFGSYFGGELCSRLEFRTINGVCARIIQYYGRLIGKKPFELVTDDRQTSGILSAIYRQVQGDYATESDLKGIRTLITYIKNSMLTAEETAKLDEESDFRISEIYRAYCGELRSRALMDYDDQMIYACTILKNSQETLRHFQDCYPYLCVDEAQDTSRIQHEIIRLLAGQRDNLFMVGDEDQSIYGFRAAYPEALLSFEENHRGAKVLLMEENYRSNAKIVTAADWFIQKNTLRHEKHMRAAREEGADIRFVTLKGRGAQYTYLAKVAENCDRQTAVLYRDNESVLPLVDQLERKGLSYRIRNAELTFFTHRVVQDIRNIMEFALHPEDRELFLQIYYKLFTYISREEALRICEICETKKGSVLDIAISYGQLPERTQQSCRALRNHFHSLSGERADLAIDRIVREMGYGKYLERAGMSDSKLYILKVLGRSEESPESFLERLTRLQTVIQEKVFDPEAAFILSTIHASKGLEYDTVYLMDAADGIFPEAVPQNLKTADRQDLEDYEEERRLFYVGITRAKERLFVFEWDRKSTFCSQLKEKPLSRDGFVRFCDGLGEGLIVEHRKFGQGVVAETGETTVVILFGGRERRLDLKTLYRNDLLII
nr:ATP-dependent helicase [uncultured Acetatifactor sp.]